MATALEYLEKAATNLIVTASALHGGTFTLPLHLFVAGTSNTERSLVPSLSFLLVHQGETGHKTNILFDLGLRRNTEAYAAPIRDHLPSRQPLKTLPDVHQTLVDGGVSPESIDHVILSHVHWDHTGTPQDYPQAQFWVGSGALRVLEHGLGPHMSHSHFEADLFRGLRVEEFPEPTTDNGRWQKAGNLLAYDFLGDGSIYVVDAPGHLPGHVNLLARVGEKQWIYLVGDACHDERLLTGEREIAAWKDEEGRSCCIHVDKQAAEATLARIRQLKREADESGFHLQVVLAHGVEWAEANPGAFLPGAIATI